MYRHLLPSALGVIVLALLVLGLSPHASKICVVGDFSQTHLKEATFGQKGSITTSLYNNTTRMRATVGMDLERVEYAGGRQLLIGSYEIWYWKPRENCVELVSGSRLPATKSYSPNPGGLKPFPPRFTISDTQLSILVYDLDRDLAPGQWSEPAVLETRTFTLP